MSLNYYNGSKCKCGKDSSHIDERTDEYLCNECAFSILEPFFKIKRIRAAHDRRLLRKNPALHLVLKGGLK